MKRVQSPFELEVFGKSDVGLVRSTNQDVWNYNAKIDLFLLADGMGGHQAGEVAAQKAVEYIEHHFEKNLEKKERVDLVLDAIVDANQKIFDLSKKKQEYEGMGTTVCLLTLFQRMIVIAHVGDSRIYRLRDHRLQQLTEDHTLAQEMLDAQEDQSKISQCKNILTKALGTYPFIEPSIDFFPWHHQDIYLICSDGLTNFVSNHRIEIILSTESSVQEKIDHLIGLAKQQGGGDNITCVVLQIHER